MSAGYLSLDRLVTRVLYLFALSIPCEEVFKLDNIIPGLPVVSLSRIIGLVLVAVFFLELLFTRKLKRSGGLDYLLITFSYGFLILTAFTFEYGDLGKAFSAFNVLVMCWIVLQKVKGISELRTLAGYFFIGTVITLLALVLGKLLGLSSLSQESSFARQTAFGFDKNVTAYILSMGLACVIYFQSVYKSRLLFLLLVVYALTSLYGIILTGSKSGMALYGIVSLTYFFMGKNGMVLARRIGLVTLLLVFIIPTLLSIAPEHQVARISTTFDSVKYGEFTGREYLWKAGAAYFLEHPFKGAGLGGFQGATGLDQPAHNAFIQVAVEAGFLGLLLYTISLLFPLHRIKRFNRPEVIFLSSMLFCQFMGIFFLNWYIHKRSWLWISVLVAASYSLSRKKRWLVGRPDGN